MALKNRNTEQQVRNLFQQKEALIERLIVQNLFYLGEECVNHARDLRTYTDRTGNLRSSIGYVVIANGRIVGANFEESPGPDPGEKNGRATGERLANQRAGQFQTGFALVVVAGMGYADFVQSRGYDVLESAEQLAEREMPVLLRKIKSQIERIGQ